MRSAGPPQASVLTLAFRTVVTAGTAPSGALPVSGVFRPDINALRAWAVVAVVLYHFNIAGFSSGFVGVDIFFVISGYLITSQALAQLEAGNFSFPDFWTARLRRIFPALIVMVLATLFFGAWLTMPDAFLRHIRQMLFAVTFLSNITFGDARGYFDTAAQTKPLLHTWSLAIEWQFYLLMPLVLAAVWRALPAAHKKFSLLALLVLSMLLSMGWFFSPCSKRSRAPRFSRLARVPGSCRQALWSPSCTGWAQPRDRWLRLPSAAAWCWCCWVGRCCLAVRYPACRLRTGLVPGPCFRYSVARWWFGVARLRACAA